MSPISLFEGKQVRGAWNEDEQKWYFSIEDVVGVLTDSINVKDYIKKLRKRDSELSAYWGTNCPLVEMVAGDGKRRKIRAAHTEACLRIIQSIPSFKAEPFKRWLEGVGYERLSQPGVPSEMELREEPPPYSAPPVISPAEQALVDELVADGLSIQDKFRPEPNYKKTGKGHYESTTVEDIRRAKQAADPSKPQ